MGLLAAALLVGSLLNDGLFGGAFYTKWIFLIPSALFSGVLVLCLVQRGGKGLWFYLSHGGLILVIVGALLGWAIGREATFQIPIDSNTTYGEVQMSSGELLSFGFDISAQSFALERKGEAVSQYTAELRVIDGETDDVRPMKVNAPVAHRGWKFYLMDYDHENQSYLFLYAKKDPGNRLFAAGLWMIVIGTAGLCFQGAFGAKGNGGRNGKA